MHEISVTVNSSQSCQVFVIVLQVIFMLFTTGVAIYSRKLMQWFKSYSAKRIVNGGFMSIISLWKLCRIPEMSVHLYKKFFRALRNAIVFRPIHPLLRSNAPFLCVFFERPLPCPYPYLLPASHLPPPYFSDFYVCINLVIVSKFSVNFLY